VFEARTVKCYMSSEYPKNDKISARNGPPQRNADVGNLSALKPQAVPIVSEAEALCLGRVIIFRLPLRGWGETNSQTCQSNH